MKGSVRHARDDDPAGWGTNRGWGCGIMRVEFSRRAAKVLKSLDRPTQARILAGIRKIPDGDIKPLKGTEDTYRLRIGGWRILFSPVGGEIIVIDRISPRGDAYKEG